MTPEELAEKVRWGGTLKASRYGEAALSELVARAKLGDRAERSIAVLGEDWAVERTRAEAAEARLATLTAALVGLLDRYLSIANSGDCGFWNPEDESQVKAARAALHEGEKP